MPWAEPPALEVSSSGRRSGQRAGAGEQLEALQKEDESCSRGSWLASSPLPASRQVQLLERQQEEVQERRLVAGGGGGEVDHTLLSVVGACSGRTNLREESENTVQVLENQFYN